LDPLPPHDYFTRLQRRHGVMDRNMKLLLDEMDKTFTALDLRWEKKISDLIRNKDDCVSVLEKAHADLEA
jgi:hypothetical protein